MMPSKAWILLGVGLACAWPGESVCEHAAKGKSHPVSLEDVEKGQEGVKRQLTATWEKSTKLSMDTPFDSGLPACVSRQTRRIRTSLPPQLVGKTIVFARADRLPRADVRVATSARRIADIDADALADGRLTERLGVRCFPTLVRAVSEAELELLENP
jgi:hypothetical protein